MSATDKTYLSCAETAKLLRTALKAEFPGWKFSVRSHTYAGGASINVGWTDGPTQPEVQSVCNLYSGASFDGMIDLKSYHDSLLMGEDGPEVVSFGADFIFAERTLSEAWVSAIASRISRLSDGKPCNLSSRISGDWWTTYPVCVHAGQLGRYAGEEAASTLVHQYAHNRRRMPLKALQKS